MKTFYDFAAHTPPHLTAERLQAIRAGRRLRRQTRLLYLSAGACQALVILLGCLLYTRAPVPAALCMGYGLLACAGTIAVAAVSVRKEVS